MLYEVITMCMCPLYSYEFCCPIDKDWENCKVNKSLNNNNNENVRIQIMNNMEIKEVWDGLRDLCENGIV